MLSALCMTYDTDPFLEINLVNFLLLRLFFLSPGCPRVCFSCVKWSVCVSILTPVERISSSKKTSKMQSAVSGAAAVQMQSMVADLEVEMMSDMYRRMTEACQKKCIPSNYREGELTKGESVCLDRCVAKYLDIHERLGKKLTVMSTQDDSALQSQQQQPP